LFTCTGLTTGARLDSTPTPRHFLINFPKHAICYILTQANVEILATKRTGKCRRPIDPRGNLRTLIVFRVSRAGDANASSCCCHQCLVLSEGFECVPSCWGCQPSLTHRAKYSWIERCRCARLLGEKYAAAIVRVRRAGGPRARIFAENFLILRINYGYECRASSQAKPDNATINLIAHCTTSHQVSGAD